MNRTTIMSSLAVLGFFVSMHIVQAQVATTISKADMAGLSPEIRGASETVSFNKTTLAINE